MWCRRNGIATGSLPYFPRRPGRGGGARPNVVTPPGCQYAGRGSHRRGRLARHRHVVDVHPPLPPLMRVLGIDPGLRRTGFGVIDAEGMRLRYVASGTIVVPPALALPERLKVILDNLRQVARDTRPDDRKSTRLNSSP